MPGVYTDWPSAQKQITGWTKPKHRCFPSRAEAEAFVKGGGAEEENGAPELEVAAKETNRLPADLPTTRLDAPTAPLSRPPEKKVKRTKDAIGDQDERDLSRPLMPSPQQIQERFMVEPGTGPLPPHAEDGFDPDIFLNRRTGRVEYKCQGQREQWVMQPQGLKPAGVLRIYTDGSSLGNGQYGAVSGVGVYFGDNDDRFVCDTRMGLGRD